MPVRARQGVRAAMLIPCLFLPAKTFSCYPCTQSYLNCTEDGTVMMAVPHKDMKTLQEEFSTQCMLCMVGYENRKNIARFTQHGLAMLEMQQ